MSEDADLAAIRARRLAEMQGQAVIAPPAAHNNFQYPEGAGDGERQRQSAQREREQEQMRYTVLARILTNEARERLSRISMVKPERGRALEDLLINAARSGQLRGSSPQGQVTEPDLVGLLGKISDQEAAATSHEGKIRFERRQSSLDDDDDL